jgi:serine/threonine protein kinase/Flp pilus assembly protein TadD
MLGKTLGHYEILEKIGSGGMGAVYRARDRRLHRDVALKVLPAELARDPDLRKRFQREAETVASLKHPNIVTIFSVEEVDDIAFITMELVEGTPLSGIIPAQGLSLDRFFDLAIPLTDAVAGAHAKGVTHRDLKPTNIMVDNAGRIEVLDFGLAKLVGPDQAQKSTIIAGQETATQEGRILGTAAYMSPEQAEGKPVDHRSDIFSLGIIFYEMITGRRPFQGDSNMSTLTSILRDTPPPVTELKQVLPRHLGRIVKRCLAKDRERRYQAASDVRNELEALKEEIDSGEMEAASSSAASNLPSQKSLVVTYFENIGGSEEDEYFRDGITEDIIVELSKIKGLHVFPRSAVLAYRDKPATVPQISKDLGTTHVLGGTFRRAGNRLRITAQLVEASTGHSTWAERFDRQMEDVFAIQDEIAKSIAHAMEVVLTEKELEAIEKAPTANVQAYDYYLRARQFFYQFRRKGVDAARKLFARAYELDPEYASAYAGVANCCSLTYMYWDATDLYLREADEASARALRIDPNLAEAHAARGLAVSLNRRYDEAEREFETAIRQDPDLFEAYYFFGRACFAQGKHEQAADLFEKAYRVQPEDYSAPSLLAASYGALGRPEDAKDARRRSLEAAEKHLELFPDDARALYIGAAGWIALGERDRGRQWAERALEADPEDPLVLYNVACSYTSLGETDKAIRCLDEAITFGYGQKDWLENDSDLDPLRADPRFQALLERL